LLLRRWLGIAEPVRNLANPSASSDFLTAEFDQYWEQQLYRTEAKVLRISSLVTNQAWRIADQATRFSAIDDPTGLLR